MKEEDMGLQGTLLDRQNYWMTDFHSLGKLWKFHQLDT